MARTRFALVGAGVIGTHHGKVMHQLHDELELVAVVDPDVARARTLAALHGAGAYCTLTDALSDVEFDAVSVCTPTGAHGEVAIEALRSGKHVLIEKPAEVSLEKTDAIIAAQQRAGTVVSVVSQHRFDPATEIVLAAIESGGLGQLTSGIAAINWWRGQKYYDSGDWRGTWRLDGGGALMNQGVHTVDLLVAALGTPVEVFAYTASLAHEGLGVEDVAAAVVKFASGALGVLHGTTAAFPGLNARLQIHGDQGSAVIDNDVLTFIHTSPPPHRPGYPAPGAGQRSQVHLHGSPQTVAPTAGEDPGSLSDSHRLQFKNFLAAIRGEEDIRVGLTENRTSLSVILGAYESARTGLKVSLV